MKVEFLDERKRKLGGREGGKKDHVKYPWNIAYYHYNRSNQAT